MSAVSHVKDQLLTLSGLFMIGLAEGPREASIHCSTYASVATATDLPPTFWHHVSNEWIVEGFQIIIIKYSLIP